MLRARMMLDFTSITRIGVVFVLMIKSESAERKCLKKFGSGRFYEVR